MLVKDFHHEAGAVSPFGSWWAEHLGDRGAWVCFSARVRGDPIFSYTVECEAPVVAY